MISDDTVERYYYIFDSREHRTLVMDRETGEEYMWEGSTRAQLAQHVQDHCSAQTLRRFAQWCARKTDIGSVPLHTTAGRLWAAVRREPDPSAVQHVRTDAADAAVLAAAVGLPRGEGPAARLLTVHACTHPSPYRAALDAAHMSERWAEFEADADAGAQVMRQRQVNWLLDAISLE